MLNATSAGYMQQSTFLFSSARRSMTVKMAPRWTRTRSCSHPRVFFFSEKLHQYSNFPAVACTHTYMHCIHCDAVTQLYVWMPYIHCLLIFVQVEVSLFSSLMLKPGLALVNWFVEDIQRRWVGRKCVKQQRHLCD